MAKEKSRELKKVTFHSLVRLVNDPNPTQDKITKAFKSASRKGIEIDRRDAGFYKRLYETFDKANLSLSELKKLHSQLESYANNLQDKGKIREAREYSGIATYLHFESIRKLKKTHESS